MDAVKGVINVITKQAKDTQSGLTTGVGSQERGFGNVRYSGKLDDNAYFRFYVKYFNRDSFDRSSGPETGDQWDVSRGDALMAL